MGLGILMMIWPMVGWLRAQLMPTRLVAAD
jgi:hypothetical protein